MKLTFFSVMYFLHHTFEQNLLDVAVLKNNKHQYSMRLGEQTQILENRQTTTDSRLTTPRC